jgi:hypothetical protein
VDGAALESLVQSLQAEVARLQARLAQLERENAQLRQQLDEAQRQAARQAAPFRRRDSRKIPKDQHKPTGRPCGHPGAYRPVPAIVDEHHEVPLPQCPQCGGPVSQVEPIEQFIEEAPPPRPIVTRLVTYRGTCPRCGDVQSRHPPQCSQAQGAAAVQLGPRAVALATTLNKRHGLTLRTTCAVLKDLIGLRLSPGGLVQATTRVAAKLSGAYNALIDRLRHSPAVFADETSWYVGVPGWWLWAFTSADTTVYHVAPRRDSGQVKAVLGEAFDGMLVSDCLSSYDDGPVPYPRKHKCIAHHQRAIAAALRRPDTKDPSYLEQWRSFFELVTIITKAHAAMPAEEYAAWCKYLESECDRLLNLPRGQPGDEAISYRLSKQRRHLLGCLYEPAAEPTNNRAERALRPAVIARKLSCGNRTDAGRRTWQTLVSVLQSCRQRGEACVDYLAARVPMTPQQPLAVPLPTR